MDLRFPEKAHLWGRLRKHARSGWRNSSIHAILLRFRRSAAWRHDQATPMLLKADPRIGGETIGIGRKCREKSLHFGANRFVCLHFTNTPDSRDPGHFPAHLLGLTLSDHPKQPPPPQVRILVVFEPRRQTKVVFRGNVSWGLIKD